MPGKHALIIGNSQYEDPTLAKLKAPEADVRVLAELLNDSAIGQFDSVRAVIDESEATTRRAIAGFFAQGKPDDLLLLYFSGHGVLDDKGRLYLAAKDTQRDLPQATAIPAAFITDGMDSSRSRRQVLILDCCHSGAFARGARSATGAKAITETTFEGVGYGRAVLTATDATQYAWEGEAVIGAAENSVFTHYMIEGLRSGAADTDADGEITLEELYDYIYGQVVKQTPKQTPRKWSYNQEGTLVIARNPKPIAAKAAPLPPELQQTIDDSRPWVREGGVSELSRLLSGSRPGLARAALEALQQLTSDDSRRVAEAANKALAAHRPASEPSAAEQQAERERLSREAERKLAEQQQVREAELANRKATEEAERLAAEREAEKRKQTLPQVEDRRAVERAEGEGMVVHPPTPSAPTESEPTPQAPVETEGAHTAPDDADQLAAEREVKKPQQAEDRRAIERAEGEGMVVHAPTPSAPTPSAPAKSEPAPQAQAETEVARTQKEEADQLAAEREAEKLKQAAPKAEDRRAIERAEGEGMVVHSPTPSAPATPQPAPETSLTPAEDRRAIERAEGEGMAASLPQPVAEPRLPASVAAWIDKPWFPLAVLSAGWGLALFSSIFIYWILELNGQDASGLAYWLVLGFLSGAATWYALRVATPNARAIQPMLIIGLWMAAALFGLWLYPLLESNIGIDESVAACVAVFGAVGGTATSVVLYRMGRIVNRQRAAIIAGGWAIAWLVGGWLALSLLNLFGGDVPSGIKESLMNLGLSYDVAYMLMPWVDALIRGLTGALAGFIGGRVMLRQLRRDQDKESVQTERPANVQRPMEAASRERNQTTVGEKSLIETIPGPAVWAGPRWFPLTMMSLGWGLAFFISTSLFWFLYQNGQEISASRFGELLVLGALGGTATWLALRAVTPKGNVLPPLLIIGGWVAITLVGVWLNPFLQDNGLGIDESVAWERATFGVLGGAFLGAVLYRRRMINTQQATFIAAGWAIGWAVAGWLALSTYNVFGDDPRYGIKMAFVGLGLEHDFTAMLVPWADSLIRGLMGALAGLISGWVMLGQLRDSKPHDS